MNVKAALILAAVLALITAMIFLILYGIGGRQNLQTTIPLPSDKAAQAYVLDKKLLVSVSKITTINAGGPNFTMLQGNDEAGNAAIVWLTGKDNEIVVRGSTLVKDGVPQETVIAKLKEKNIDSTQIEDMFISPYDYTSGRIIWFVREKNIRKHWLSYDFKTGEFLWDVFQDPTAWKL
ncbi:MAG: putative rane protein [Bacilli bacterium]|nr:putative rane protein [Bacilli bacterium]